MVEIIEKKSVREQAIEMLRGDESLTLTEVGNRLGRSKERIRQIADNIPGASRHRRKYCSACWVRILVRQGRHAWRMGFCPKCWPVEQERRWKERWLRYRTRFICQLCGREFFRENSDVRRSQKENQSSIRFCSYSCRSRWLWTYGAFRRK